MSENEIIITERPKVLSLGALPTTGPVALIQQASEIATELAKIIKAKKLSSRIQGREFVHVEGWSTMGAMLGVLPREVPNGTRRLEDGSYEATVELIRINDGAIIGRASALCGMDEKDRKGKLTWGNRAEYARRSMAVTRATGKAYRLGFSWIMALAGYEPTPAEEIVDGTFEEQKPAQKPARKAPVKTAKKPAAKRAAKPSEPVLKAAEPEKWDTLPEPENYTDLYNRVHELDILDADPEARRKHAAAIIKKTYPDNEASTADAWQAIITYQRSKLAEAPA